MRTTHLLILATVTSVVCALPAQIYVSPSGSDATGTGSSANPFKTISHAASTAAPGDVVQLSAGVFGDDEQITLGDKDLTILGVGVGQTIVHPHLTLSRQLLRGALPGVLAEHRVVFVVDGSARVEIRDLTVDGVYRMPATGRLGGFYFRDGADGSLDNIEVRGMRADPLSGAQGPVAVLVRGDNQRDPCDVTVYDSTIHDWGKGGLVAAFNADLTVEYSTVTGGGALGAGDPAQNCIQVGFGARGVIRHNTITDSHYTPSTWGASGVLLYDSGPSIVAGNDVARCEESIWVVSPSSASVAIEIRNNQVTAAASRGCRVDSTTGVTVQDNVLHATTSSTNPSRDNTAAGNTWRGNNYSSYSGVGSFRVGGGGYVDTTPRRGLDGFMPVTKIDLTRRPVDLVVADLDGVAGLDIATANLPGDNPTLSIALSNGSGYTIAAVPFASVRAVPVAVVAGEFDGSAGLDLAVVTRNNPPATGQNNLHIFANDGNGGFSLLHTQPLPAALRKPSDLAVANLDGSGADDVVVGDVGDASNPGGGAVLLNLGGGTSWLASALPGTYSSAVRSVATGRVDADAATDIVVAEGGVGVGWIHVLRGDGSGGFTVLTGTPLAVDSEPTALAIGDLDADGDNEIIATSALGSLTTGPGSVTVFDNALAAGFSATVYATEANPAAVAFGDLDDDADPRTVRRDVVVANATAGSLTMLGEFEATNFTGGGLAPAGRTPIAIVIAPMNGDSYHDIVVADRLDQSVLVFSGRPRARGDLYGRGCMGTDGRLPQITASGLNPVPKQPNSDLMISLRNARPNSVALMIGGFGTNPLVNSCLHVSLAALVQTVTDANGGASFPLVIPRRPPLAGFEVYLQWLTIDPQGTAFTGQASTSRALKVRLGF